MPQYMFIHNRSSTYALISFYDFFEKSMKISWKIYDYSILGGSIPVMRLVCDEKNAYPHIHSYKHIAIFSHISYVYADSMYKFSELIFD